MTKPDAGDGPGDGLDELYAREIELLSSLRDEPIELTDAPRDLWDLVAAAVAGDDHVEPTDTAAPDPPRDRTRLTVLDGGNEPTTPTTDTTTPHRTNRWRTGLLGVAAVIAVLAIGAGAIITTRNDNPTELAAAELTPFEGAQVGAAGGRVELIEDRDQIRLRVDMHDLPAPAPGTFYELWLLDPDTGEPVSIATMKDGSSDVVTDIDLPPTTDTTRFDTVDISVQEDSAGPQHSGNSVLRGTLTA